MLAPEPTAGWTTIARVDQSLIRSGRRLAVGGVALQLAFGCLIAAAILGAIAMSPLYPPRALDDSALSTPN